MLYLNNATQFVTTEEERIWLFIRGLNFELEVLSVHMSIAGRRFNELTDFVKKVEGVRQDVEDKARVPGRPTVAARPIKSIMPASIGNYSRTPPQNFCGGFQPIF